MSVHATDPPSESGGVDVAQAEAVLLSAYFVVQSSGTGSTRDERDAAVVERIPKFSPRKRVQIVGLRNYSHLNGSYGRIKGKSDFRMRRWVVELEEAQRPSALVSVREQNLLASKEYPSSECCVLLHSLRDRKDLNGRSVFVVRTDSAKSSRVIVRSPRSGVARFPVAAPMACGS